MKLNPYDSFYRRRRPHWQRDDAWHFVTFRLEGTLPANAIERLEREAVKMSDELSNKYSGKYETQSFYYHKWRFNWIENYLDMQTNVAHLKKREIAIIVKDTILYYENINYELDAWVIMPNHVHLLIKPKNEIKINQILQRIKSYTGKEINKLLERHGKFWQEESFDHWIRPGKFLYWHDYIINNPVKAKLCKFPEDWAWSSAYNK